MKQESFIFSDPKDLDYNVNLFLSRVDVLAVSNMCYQLGEVVYHKAVILYE